MIQLAHRNTYIRYVDYYALPGQQPETGGYFLQQGYGHIVIHGNDLGWLERSATHELTHALLQHFNHPPWLREGLAMAIEVEPGDRALVLSTGVFGERYADQLGRYGAEAHAANTLSAPRYPDGATGAELLPRIQAVGAIEAGLQGCGHPFEIGAGVAAAQRVSRQD